MLRRNYNSSLIKILSDEHKKIFDAYLSLKDSFEKSSNFEEILDKLNILKITLDMHLNFEDSTLYTYLKYKYRNDNAKLNFIIYADKEMKDIAKSALKFIEECSDYKTYLKKREEFIKELNLIGEVITKRVAFEEGQLYPLYKE